MARKKATIKQFQENQQSIDKLCMLHLPVRIPNIPSNKSNHKISGPSDFVTHSSISSSLAWARYEAENYHDKFQPDRVGFKGNRKNLKKIQRKKAKKQNKISKSQNSTVHGNRQNRYVRKYPKVKYVDKSTQTIPLHDSTSETIWTMGSDQIHPEKINKVEILAEINVLQDELKALRLKTRLQGRKNKEKPIKDNFSLKHNAEIRENTNIEKNNVSDCNYSDDSFEDAGSSRDGSLSLNM